jgi:hypothetical protein
LRLSIFGIPIEEGDERNVFEVDQTIQYDKENFPEVNF